MDLVRSSLLGFTGGAMVKNLPANARASLSSSLPQSCPGSGTEDLCQTVPAIPSSLEKHQEPYSLQWMRSVLGSVAPDLERGMPG